MPLNTKFLMHHKAHILDAVDKKAGLVLFAKDRIHMLFLSGHIVRSTEIYPWKLHSKGKQWLEKYRSSFGL